MKHPVQPYWADDLARRIEKRLPRGTVVCAQPWHNATAIHFVILPPRGNDVPFRYVDVMVERAQDKTGDEIVREVCRPRSEPHAPPDPPVYVFPPGADA